MDNERLRKLTNIVKEQWWVFFAVIFTLMGMYGIWSAEYLGFQDHPSHLLRAHIAINYTNPAYDYNKYFLLNWGLAPNQGSDAIIFLLSHIVPVAAAAKLFFCIYIIFLPLSVWYFLYCVRRENCPYTLLASALTFNRCVLLGNENFFSSIPMFFFFLGNWYTHRDNFRMRARFTSSILLLVVYYCHMLSFACALLVMVTISLVEKRGWHALARTAVVALPSLSLFLVWVATIVMQGGTQESGLTLLASLPSWRERLGLPIGGIVPFVRLDFLRQTFLLFLLVLLGTGMVQAWRRGAKAWFWAEAMLGILAGVLPWCCIVFNPGQRVAYLAVLLASVVLPKRRVVRSCFLVFLVIFTMAARIQEIEYLDTASRMIAYSVEPFKEAGQDMRNHKKKVLPLVLYPYTLKAFGHRLFEYYTLFNGGINPYHLMSQNFTVRYRKRLPAPPLYENAFPEGITKEMFELYDIIIVIGKGGYHGKELLNYISAAGFREVSGNVMTGVFRKI